MITRGVRKAEKLQYRMHARMAELMAGATLGDWLWLRKIPDKVFLYNSAGLSVGKAESVPWPIKFALTRHSKKKMFLTAVRPQRRISAAFYTGGLAR